jgi:integrase
LKLPKVITTYYARHSWATIAYNDCKISEDDISLSLGHKDPSKKVTDIYLNKSLKIIDKANRKVLDLMKNPGELTSGEINPEMNH